MEYSQFQKCVDYCKKWDHFYNGACNFTNIACTFKLSAYTLVLLKRMARHIHALLEKVHAQLNTVQALLKLMALHTSRFEILTRMPRVSIKEVLVTKYSAISFFIIYKTFLYVSATEVNQYLTLN